MLLDQDDQGHVPPAWTSLGAAAVAAINTSARGFASDQRDVPADANEQRLWGEFAGCGDLDDPYENC